MAEVSESDSYRLNAALRLIDDKDDIVVQGRKVTVTVHSLGAVDTLPTKLTLLDQSGKVLSSAPIPGLKAPVDLLPKRITVTLTLSPGVQINGCRVVIDTDVTIKEITRINNYVYL